MLDLLPKKIIYENFSLISYFYIDDKHEFLQQMNKYRNLFRKNFGDTSLISIQESKAFLEQFNPLNKKRILYAIYIEDVLVGQYGLRMYPDGYVLLDYAVRYKPLGPKNLFSLVSKVLVSEILSVNQAINVFTAIKAGNIAAKRLHISYGLYEQMDASFYKRFGISEDLQLRKFCAFS